MAINTSTTILLFSLLCYATCSPVVKELMAVPIEKHSADMDFEDVKYVLFLKL